MNGFYAFRRKNSNLDDSGANSTGECLDLVLDPYKLNGKNTECSNSDIFGRIPHNRQFGNLFAHTRAVICGKIIISAILNVCAVMGQLTSNPTGPRAKEKNSA